MRPLRTHHGNTCWVRVDDSTGRVTVERGYKLLREELEELKYEIEAALAWLDERDYEGEPCLFCGEPTGREESDVCDTCYDQYPAAQRYVRAQAKASSKPPEPIETLLPPETSQTPRTGAVDRWLYQQACKAVRAADPHLSDADVDVRAKRLAENMTRQFIECK